jgi:hypothetical protein
MRRSSELAALVLGLLVLAAPAVPFIIRPSAHHLAEIDLVSLLLYWTVGTALLVAPLIALTTLPGDWFERWWQRSTDRVMAVSNRAFAIGLVTAATVLAAAFGWYCFVWRPTTADEIAQLFHARILLSGHLSLPQDPNPEFFAIDNVIDSPRWMSQFPIGGPAILALGVAIGAPWLLNALLTGLTALNVYRFAQAAYSEAQARAAGLLVALSPMVLIMGGSQMNHTPTAFFVTLAMASLARWLRDDCARPQLEAAVVGGALGVAVTIRPLDGTLAVALMGTAMLWRAARDSTRRPSVLSAIGAGAVPVALLLAANWTMTGHPLLFGYEMLWGPNHSWGLHDDPLGTTHDATRALLLGLKYTVQLQWALTAWPLPILLLIAFGFAASRQTTRWDLTLLAAFFVQLVAYAMYWHDGQFVGPRFLFTVTPAVLVLASRAPFMLAEVAKGNAWRAAVALVPACVFMSWVRPMEPFGVRGITRDYRTARTLFKRSAPGKSVIDPLPRSLVFVQEGASAREARRLWGLGISRKDAARLIRGSDACSLLDAIRREEALPPADTAGHLMRIEATTIMLGAPTDVIVPNTDPYFRVNRNSMVSRACILEINFDAQVGNSVIFGPLLLHNRFDKLGRLDGQVIYAMNLGDRNNALRARFGDRQWFRYEVPADKPDSSPVLVPYDTPPKAKASASATKKAP